MQSNEYLEKSSRTVSEVSPDKRIITAEQLLKIFSNTHKGNFADCLKREIFYNTPIEKTEERYEEVEKRLEKIYDAIFNGQNVYKVTQREIDIFHAILGLISETSEIIESFAKSLVDNGEIDSVNMMEEVGDMLWYQALLLRNVNSNFEECMSKNIKKLEKRFPGKFSTENAVDRDLVKEREILES